MFVLLVEPEYRAKFPPIGLLKIGTYHRRRGDDVEYVRGRRLILGEPERIYMTSLYTWEWMPVRDAVRYYKALFPDSEIILGGIYASLMDEHAYENIPVDRIHIGTLDNKLLFDENVDKLPPSYDLLKGVDPWDGWDASILYTTRGCSTNCPYCIVPRIEGKLRVVIDSIKDHIEENHSWIVLLDNDFLANPERERFLDELESLGKKVDFNQGLRASSIDENIAERLSKLDLRRFPEGSRCVRIAYDHLWQSKSVEGAIKNLRNAGFKDRGILVYNLYNWKEGPDDFLERVRNTLKWGATSYPMRYQPLSGKNALDKDKFVSPSWNEEFLSWIPECLRLFGGRDKGGRGTFPPYKALIDMLKTSDNFKQAFKPQHLKLKNGELRAEKTISMIDLDIDRGDVLGAFVSSFEEVAEKGLLRGRSEYELSQAVLLAVLRDLGYPTSLDDVAEASGVARERLVRDFKFISKNLGKTIPPPSPEAFARRFADYLGISDKTVDAVLKVIEMAKDEGLINGRNPKSIAAAAIYLACDAVDEHVIQSEVANASGVTKVGIRERSKEFLKKIDIRSIKPEFY